MGPDRYHRLHVHRFRHADPAFAKAFSNANGDRVIAHKFASKQLSNDLAGKIVARWPESAGDDEHIGASESFGHGAAHLGAVVGDGGLAIQAQADVGELARDVREMRVGREAEEQFAARVDQLDAHSQLVFGSPLLCGRNSFGRFTGRYV